MYYTRARFLYIPRFAEFYVNGSAIPDVDFNIGPSWEGLLPISADPNETRKVRNIFFLILEIESVP